MTTFRTILRVVSGVCAIALTSLALLVISRVTEGWIFDWLQHRHLYGLGRDAARLGVAIGFLVIAYVLVRFRLTGMRTTLAHSLRAVVAGSVALALSYSILNPAGAICAITIRRQWPEAWFSGLIVWYAYFFAVGLSFAIAVAVWRVKWRKPEQANRY
jgi:hypothetical protein